YPVSISKILSFKYIEKPQLIADFIFLLCLIFVLGYISFYYMLFGIIYSLISVVLSYFLKRYNEKNFDNNNLLKNQTDYNFQMLYDFLYKEKNLIKSNHLINNCKSYFWSLSKQNISYSNYVFQNNFLKNFLKKIVFVVFVIISLYWINNNSNQNIDVGKMIFAITALNLFDNTTNSVFLFISELANYKKSKIMLDNFLTKENKEIISKNKISIKEIKSIKIFNLNFEYDRENKIFTNFNFELENNTLIYGKNGIGKSTLLKILSLNLPISKKSELLFNDLNYTDINLKDFENRICYIPSDAIPVEVDYSAILYNNPGLTKSLSVFLKETKLSTKSIYEFSKGEVQLSNLISLLNLKNNLILLDECFSNVSESNIELFMKLFYPSISESNFVVCVSHSNILKKYFNNHKEVK
ncbi:MAG: ATP-binding cassette domain-containing protein, partial [Malacoplasma sp.]|nr:ATP-binding cassette domain-containing protein [Malacoplasma sp.]